VFFSILNSEERLRPVVGPSLRSATGQAQDRKRERLLKCKEVHHYHSGPLHRVAVISKTEAFSLFFFISFFDKKTICFFS
jgi:hypothetical protein